MAGKLSQKPSSSGRRRSFAAPDKAEKPRKKLAIPPNPTGKVALHMLSGELLSPEDTAGDTWYDCAPTWPERAEGGLSGSAADWAEVAGHALAAVGRAFEKSTGSDEEARKRVLGKEKTTGDRIAAVTLMVQESPVHRLGELRVLLGYAKKVERRERGPAIDAMKDLFLNDLLPDGRRLVGLADRDWFVGKGQLTKRHLAYAMFEDELKGIFREFLGVVDACSKDVVVHFKQKATRACFDLLVAKPENERVLLSMLVNELGSPERRAASDASYYLNLIVSKHHPAMKLVVVKEVEQLVHRVNVGLRTRYYAVSFLNQMRFTSGADVELSRKLVRIYMELFAEGVASDRQGAKQKGSGGLETKESRLMGALLTGVNRAFPYSKPEEDDTDYSKQFESLFQVAHAQSLTSATQALSFLFQVAQTNSVVSDRFYRALYSRIPDTTGAGESKQALFMNLLFKAMKADVSAKRLKAFSKRLLQAALHGSPGFSAAALMVISEVMVMRRKGLLKSFVVLSEGDDADEEFRDADDSDDDAAPADGSDVGSPEKEAEPKENAEANINTDTVTDKATQAPATVVWGSGYEPAKRDPLYARAEESCLWEIVALCSHYHPSVVSFAKRLRVEMAAVEYGGDPLKDFTLGAFLDKFCYRKPKKHVVDSLHGRRSVRLTQKPLVNTAEFREMGDAGNIEEDDKFFLRFFQTNPDRTRRPGESAAKAVVKDEAEDGEAPAGADVDQENDSEEEAFEQAMREEMKRLGGGESGVPDDDLDIPDDVNDFDETFGADLMGDSGDSGSEEEVDDGMRLVADSDSEEADEEGLGKLSKKQKPTQKKAGSSIFASVDDFEGSLGGDSYGEDSVGDGDEGGEALGNGSESESPVPKKRKAPSSNGKNGRVKGKKGGAGHKSKKQKRF